MIDWKRKLTSRKFWVALIGFITPTLLAFNVSEEQVTQVASIIMAGAVLISYIIAEGWTDAAGSESQVHIVNVPVLEEELEDEEFDDEEEPEAAEEPEVDLSLESGLSPEQMLEG